MATDYHEPAKELSTEERDIVRALNSLKEEVEAVDWYNQRVATCGDEELKKIMAHNRDEEIEHVCMTLEWLRRNMPAWDKELRTYLFTEGSIMELEEEDTGSSSDGGDKKDIGIGDLK